MFFLYISISLVTAHLQLDGTCMNLVPFRVFFSPSGHFRGNFLVTVVTAFVCGQVASIMFNRISLCYTNYVATISEVSVQSLFISM